jgi:alcohol dehydrogenase class IV
VRRRGAELGRSGAAKALSALAFLPGRIDDYLEGKDGARTVEKRGIPWIALPTTAGSGAEATKNAVIKSASLGVKRSIRSALLLASAVIVDPELALRLPRATTGISGLDALTQLVEAYVSVRSVPPVRALIRGAFPRMLEALQKLSREPEDLTARADAAYGALVSGIALSNAGLGAAHGFASGVGGAYDIPHGLLCAVFLPHVLAANAGAILGSLEELTEGLEKGEGSGDPVQWLSQSVTALLQSYGLPTDLRGYRIPKSRVRELAEKSSGSSMKGNPRELTREEKERLLLQVI